MGWTSDKKSIPHPRKKCSGRESTSTKGQRLDQVAGFWYRKEVQVFPEKIRDVRNTKTVPSGILRMLHMPCMCMYMCTAGI